MYLFIKLSTMFLFLYGVSYNIIYLDVIPDLAGIINREIIDNGINMNNKKKTLILASFILMICVSLLYGEYCY